MKKIRNSITKNVFVAMTVLMALIILGCSGDLHNVADVKIRVQVVNFTGDDGDYAVPGLTRAPGESWVNTANPISITDSAGIMASSVPATFSPQIFSIVDSGAWSRSWHSAGAPKGNSKDGFSDDIWNFTVNIDLAESNSYIIRLDFGQDPVALTVVEDSQ